MSVLQALEAVGTGQVWRAFDHLIGVGPGRLLVVPVGLADGNLARVRDGCPVPWQEVFTLIDVPADPAARVLLPEQLARLAPLVAVHFAPFGWVHDVVPAGGAVPTMTRLTGPTGERFAWLGCGDA